MSKRKLFTKFIKVVNTTIQCSLKDMYIKYSDIKLLLICRLTYLWCMILIP
jgi:hypothetical protein